MAVGVNHAWHQDAVSRVNFHRAIWYGNLAPDRRNVFVRDEDIAMLD
jgi:hypothetical protein